MLCRLAIGWRTGFVPIAIALLCVACSSAQDRAASPGRQVVEVGERDFKITARKHVAAGEVELHVRNNGPDTHELIVVRASGTALPLRPDNVTVDEDGLKSRTVGAEDDVQPGTTRVWRLRLAPGRYVLFCNMSGHYLGGMHTELTVRE